MKKILTLLALAGTLLAGCATRPVADLTPAPAADDFGVLVMAHGGIDEWEREVEATLAPLREHYPMELAFGMADATSLQAGVERLEAQGVDRIAVVRLFVSGESWYERTRQILGLEPGAPPTPATGDHADHGEHASHSMAFWRLDSDAAFAMSQEGLMRAQEMGEVLAERARALSENPATEDVLILAHGPADDGENARWLAQIDDRADAVRQALPFRRVQVETLREDWPDEREAAEARVRGFVERAGREGGRAIVIPFRVQGFGPYGRVLEGLDYVANKRGLVPNAQVREWVDRQARTLEAGGDW